MKNIPIDNGVNVQINDDNSIITYVSGMMIDGDGSGGNLENDPCFQRDTTYQPALNARIDRFIVLPPQIIAAVPGIVIGCRATVQNLKTLAWTEAVVGDIGPRSKIGEASIAVAEALGVPSSPTTGGDERPNYKYQVYPGQPALVHGKQYVLQAR